MVDFSLPKITNAEITAVNQVLKSKWLTTGSKSIEFAKQINTFIGSKYCIPMSSCTAALHVALICAGVKEGDEVITSPMTFVSTVNTILYLRAKPVFVDIKQDDYIIDENQIEAKITKKTKAIIVVHYAGFSANLHKIHSIARKYRLEVIEDAAHAFGSKYGDSFIGNKSKFCCFSFYPTKNITSIEGGALVTDKEEVYNRAKMLSLHGISKDAWKRYSKAGTWRYDVNEIGFKYNMTDVEATLGLAQMRHMLEMQKHRQKLYELYRNELKDVPDVSLLPGNSYSNPFRHLFVIQLDPVKIKRDTFIELMKQKGIVCSVHFIPVYTFSIYKKLFSYKPSDYPITEKAFSKCVSLPFGSSLTLSEAKKTADTLKKIIYSKI